MIPTLMISRNIRCTNSLTINVSNAKILTLEVWRIAYKLNKKDNSIKWRNWYAVNARLLVWVQVLLIARSMVQISLSLNAGFAVLLLNGSVGALHISVNLAIKDRLVVTMYLRSQKKSCHNVVQQKDVRSKWNIQRMVRNLHLVVLFAGMKWRTRKISD